MSVLGVNLSFAVKRWVEPERWAAVVRNDLGLSTVQFSFDLIDPWWPEDLRFSLARRTVAACRAEGLVLDSAFVGLASYTYNQLLHPTSEGRMAGFQWFRRAIDLAAELEVRAVGGPLGATGAGEVADAEASPPHYSWLCDSVEALAEHCRQRGVSRFLIEPTPLVREIPWSVETASRLMTDLDGRTAVPVRYCVDWGHAILEPFYGPGKASMAPWLEQCGAWIDMLHIQQSDGQLDRHWGFTRQGVVDPEASVGAIAAAGLDDRPVFLEVFHPFELPDAEALTDMKSSLAVLKPHFRI